MTLEQLREKLFHEYMMDYLPFYNEMDDLDPSITEKEIDDALRYAIEKETHDYPEKFEFEWEVIDDYEVFDSDIKYYFLEKLGYYN